MTFDVPASRSIVEGHLTTTQCALVARYLYTDAKRLRAAGLVERARGLSARADELMQWSRGTGIPVARIDTTAVVVNVEQRPRPQEWRR